MPQPYIDIRNTILGATGLLDDSISIAKASWRGKDIVSRYLASLVSLLAIGMVACGGGGSNTSSSAPNPTAGTGNSGGQLVTPTAVTVAANSSSTGVNIIVPNSASAINAELLGVNSPSATTISASNTGGVVARGTQAVVLIFGKGISASLNISISGPQDISITNAQSVTATDKTPGVQFLVTVANNAAVGARTVILKDSQSNATVFTGGLEVQ